MNTPMPTGMLESADPPVGVWMQEGDLATTRADAWIIAEPEAYDVANATTECLADVVNTLILDGSITDGWMQTAHLSPDPSQRVQHFVFAVSDGFGDQFRGEYRSCLLDSGRDLDVIVEDALAGGASLYRVLDVKDPYLLAIARGEKLLGLTFVVGAPERVSALPERTVNPDGLDGAVARIAGLVRTSAGEDRLPNYDNPYLPTELPDDVWLQQDDLTLVSDQPWTAYGPKGGISLDVPYCVSMALGALTDSLQHQVASTESGDLVVHHAYLSTDTSYDPLRYVEACAENEVLGTWDGTDTSTVVLRVYEYRGERADDSVTRADEPYLLAVNKTWNGVGFTVYMGSRVDEPEVPAPPSYEISPLTGVMRDLVGHIGAVGQEYFDRCSAAGACDPTGNLSR